MDQRQRVVYAIELHRVRQDQVPLVIAARDPEGRRIRLGSISIGCTGVKLAAYDRMGIKQHKNIICFVLPSWRGGRRAGLAQLPSFQQFLWMTYTSANRQNV